MCLCSIMNRSQNDSVKHVVSSYLHNMNYTKVNCEDIPLEKFRLSNVIENKIRRPNSALKVELCACTSTTNVCECYYLVRNAIINSYTKFLTWLKVLSKSKKDIADLEALVGPLFCHLYIEILCGKQDAGKKEQAIRDDDAMKFFKRYVAAVDRNKCDDIVKHFIISVGNSYEMSINNASFNNYPKSLNKLKEHLRANKHSLPLSVTSEAMLKKFIVDHCHVVFLDVLQSWFQIDITDNVEQLDEVIKDLCCGFPRGGINTLQDAISSIKNISFIYTVNLSNTKDTISCGLIDRKSQLIAYSHNNSIFVRPTDTTRTLPGAKCKEVVLRGHTGRIYDMDLVRGNSSLLVSASNDRTVGLFDVSNYEARCILKGHNYPVYCVASSCNGNYIASGSYDSTVRLWDLQKRNTVRVFAGHKYEVTCVDFHPNGVYFLSASADKTVRMWNISDATPVRLFAGTKATVYSAAFSPDGRYIASASSDLRIWDVVSSKQVAEIKMGIEPVTHIVWSSDQKLLSIGTINGSVKIWNVEKLLASPHNSYEPISRTDLNSKLLSIEHSFETFACLTF